MGYRVDKNLNKKGIRNKKLRNRSLLAAIVFTLSIISNSIVPKTLLVTATENSKLDIDIVNVDDNVKSEDNIFELSKKAEKDNDGNINVTLEVKVNKDNIPSKNEEIEVEEVNEEKLNISPEVNKININEKITEGFEINKDSIKIEAIENGETVELNLEELKNDKLLNEDLEKNLNLTLNKVTSDIMRISYLINTNSSIKAENNIKLSEEAELKYYVLDNEKEKKVLIPNILVDIKEIQLEQENKEIANVEESVVKEELVSEIADEDATSVEDTITETTTEGDPSEEVESDEEKETTQGDNNDASVDSDSTLNIDEETTVEDEIENSKDIIKTYSRISSIEDTVLPKDTVLSNGVTIKGVKWSRTEEDENVTKISKDTSNKVELSDPGEDIGKVLITDRYEKNNNNEIYYKNIFNYEYILKYLNPTVTKNVWDGRSGARYYNNYINDKYLEGHDYPVEEFSTWTHLNDNSDDNNNTEYSWRLFRGEFNLSPEDLNNKKVYIGVASENGVQPIMPFNDTMIVLVDGKVTNLNYSTSGDKTHIELTNTKNNPSIGPLSFQTCYRYEEDGEGCTIPQHDDLTRHTDDWHAHLDVESGPNGTRLGDITSYLDTASTASNNHKVEILCGDYNSGGGGTKLEIYLVEDTAINVTKVGYLSKDGENQVINNDTKIYKNDIINYTFSMTNTGESTIKNATFSDLLLNGLEISSNGMFIKDGDTTKEVRYYNKLKITKGKLQYDGTLADKDERTGKEALELLENIKYGETIIIEDSNNIKYIVKEDPIKVTNTVNCTANYDSKSINKSAEFSFNISIIIDDLKVTKTVESITRNGQKVNFNKTDKLVSEKILPGDIVKFKIIVENRSYRIDYDIDGKESKSWIAVDGLTLNDQLSIGDYKKDINLTEGSFNLDEPTIDGNEIISRKTFCYEWTVTEDEANLYRNVVNNTVTLKKDNSILDEDKVELNILPPSLMIKKEVELNGFTDLKTDRTFTIMINGNDGTQYNIEAEKDIKYTLSNLKYGVTYTVSEIVPMNYKLVSISGGTKSSIKDDLIKDQITLTGYNNELITVTNKKVNDSFWTSENKVINVFKNFIDNIIGGVE